jgi:hypothetical protein
VAAGDDLRPRGEAKLSGRLLAHLAHDLARRAGEGEEAGIEVGGVKDRLGKLASPNVEGEGPADERVGVAPDAVWLGLGAPDGMDGAEMDEAEMDQAGLLTPVVEARR